MRPMRYGGATKRRGLEHVRGALTPESGAFLVRFEFSRDETRMVEFGEKKLRVLNPDGSVVRIFAGHEDGVPAYVTELRTPYAVSELYAVRYTQSLDVIFLTHPKHPPHMLCRNAGDHWTIGEMDFAGTPPLTDMNDDRDAKVRASKTLKDGYCMLQAQTEGFFNARSLGAPFVMEWPKPTDEVSRIINLSNLGSWEREFVMPKVHGDWFMSTTGNWSGKLLFERSYDDGATWEPYRIYGAQGDRNLDVSGEEENTCDIRVTAKEFSTPENGDDHVSIEFNVDEYYKRGVARILTQAEYEEVFPGAHIETNSPVSDIGGKGVLAKIVTDMVFEEDTHRWWDGAFCEVNGYPNAVGLYQQRLYFGGTRAAPQTVWGSAVDDIYNFKEGALDTDALRFAVSTGGFDEILWIKPLDELSVGTGAGEYRVGAADARDAVTPGSIRVNRQTAYGSTGVGSECVGDSIFYLQRGGKSIRQYKYRLEKDGYVSEESTIMAQHILGDGCVDMAFQNHPDTVLWCVRKDGKLAGMTYEQDQNVCAWFLYETDGEILSVETMPNDDGDELWMSVRRDGSVRVERMRFCQTRDFARDGAQVDFLDAFAVHSQEGAVEAFPGEKLRHLRGRTVGVLADGCYIGERTVPDDGRPLCFDARDGFTHIVAGLPYAAELETLPLDAVVADGTTQGRVRRVCAADVRLKDSGECLVGCSSRNLEPVVVRDSACDPEKPVPLFSGVRRVNFLSGAAREKNVVARSEKPVPLTVLSVVAELS